MGKHKKYTNELKKEVVSKYLAGEGSMNYLADKYGILDRKRVSVWVKQYKNGNTEFIDNRGKHSKGRPKKLKDISEMTKDEYIKQLELELEILKHFAEMMDENKD